MIFGPYILLLAPMKKILLPLFVILVTAVYAQDAPDFHDARSWMIDANDTTGRYIFADTALIRIAPDTKQAPIDTLFVGDNITIKGITSNGLTIRGLRLPWLKITYTKNGELKSGYIWQGAVSCKPMRRGDTKFVYAIERRADSIEKRGKYKDTLPQYLVRLKVVQNGKVLAKAAVTTPDDESANYSDSKVMSGMGLTNVQNVVVLDFSGDACGIATYDYYWAWTKSNQLVRFPDKYNIADAGIFYHDETFIFPNEKNGQPDRVIWNLEGAEYTDKLDKHGDPVPKINEKKSAIYVWDGVKESINRQ